jgi:hypothetical protein
MKRTAVPQMRRRRQRNTATQTDRPDRVGARPRSFAPEAPDLGYGCRSGRARSLRRNRHAHSCRLARVVGRSRVHHRRDKRLATRLRYARLRQQASFEDVDYRAPRGLDRALFGRENRSPLGSHQPSSCSAKATSPKPFTWSRRASSCSGVVSKGVASPCLTALRQVSRPALTPRSAGDRSFASIPVLSTCCWVFFCPGH